MFKGCKRRKTSHDKVSVCLEIFQTYFPIIFRIVEENSEDSLYPFNENPLIECITV